MHHFYKRIPSVDNGEISLNSSGSTRMIRFVSNAYLLMPNYIPECRFLHVTECL